MEEGSRAITIGASIGGLLASRVLADHYANVLVLERDEFPEAGEVRKGVPQSRHAHALLAAGLEVLEGFFPGLIEDIVEQGGMKTDISRIRWHTFGGYHARASGIDALQISRPRLEAYIRERVLKLPNVSIESGCNVQSLVTDGARGRIMGVNTRESSSPYLADLTCDATGRGSKTPKWLEELGFIPPVEEAIRINIGYSTRIFERRPEDLGDDEIMILVPEPPDGRGGVMLSVEGNRWLVTLIGMLGNYPPTDEQGYLDFAKSLPAPDIYETIKDAVPLTDAEPFRFPESKRRRYEALERFPEGYLVFGDAICSFNPVYGQGMSVAALEARWLDSILSESKHHVALRFFKEAAKAIDAPWTIAVGGDLQYPQVDGPRTLLVRFINWYLGKLHVAARRDPTLTLAFQRVANLQASPTSLLAPRVSWRVLRGMVSGRR